MYEQLERYIILWLPVERREVIMTSLGLLEQYGQFAAWTEISLMLETESDETTGYVIDSIEGILHKGTDIVLRAHGVHYIGEQAEKNTLLTAIQLLQNWSDPQSIINIINDGSNPTETFADLVELVTTVSWTHTIDGLIEVSDALLNKILASYQESMEELEPESPFGVTPTRKQQIIDFLTANPTTIANKMVRDDCRPFGIPTQILLNDAKLPLCILEPDAPDRAALEIVGIGLIGDIPDVVLPQRIKDLTDQVFTDMRFITAVDVHIDKILSGVINRG